jgi:octaprenyl-diphosphate synthase
MTATIHSIGEPRPPSLEPLLALVSSDMNAVNAVVLDRMQSKVGLIPNLPATSSPVAASACARC